MGDKLNDTDWDMTFEEVKRFGDHGPLHKGTIGFIEALAQITTQPHLGGNGPWD